MYPILKNVFMLSRKDFSVPTLPDRISHRFTSDEVQRREEIPYAKNLLWMVFAGSRGGKNRIKMIHALRKYPLNAHQIAKTLRLNYRAIQHHINVLEKNNLVSHIGEKYGTTYFLSNFLEVNMDAFDKIVTDTHKGIQRKV